MIEILTSGLYTSIQDLGRFGYRKYGVPLSGAMDMHSMQLANQLVGNSRELSVMEFTSSGPVLKFHKDMQIAICGAQFSPLLDGHKISLNRRISIQAKSVLKFGMANLGLRAYMAVAGGYNSRDYMGSTSYYSGITSKKRITKGDYLEINPAFMSSNDSEELIKPDSLDFNTSTIEVYKGPEFGLLSEEHQNLIFNTSFKITVESNRMAYVLEHNEGFSLNEIITSAVQPGTVQLMPSGRMAILMRDAPTTGGYARIFQLNENSINILAQKRAGEEIHFKCL